VAEPAPENLARAESNLSDQGKTHTGEVFSLLIVNVWWGFSVISRDGHA
jgi:hypothetical protein